MNTSLKLLLLSSALFSLTSCCQKMCYNQWKEKDCCYSDYYQNPPLVVHDRDYYHSDPVR
jgi:hypothetical protein